jgi:dihydropteroate synthase
MQFATRNLDLSRPHVMGILNVTPDSFSDGGQHTSLDQVIAHAQMMVEQGASFIDVGGESTRPGAKAVNEAEELDRVIPVIERLHREVDCVISVDTSKAGVIEEATKAGAALINDVRALREPGALEAAVAAGVPVCLMHMQGQPRSMQQNPQYDDVVKEVGAFLCSQAHKCIEAGIRREDIIFDPGYGFGKRLEHNYALLKYLPRLLELGFPLLVGMSRKSMLGNLLNRNVDERLAGSVAVATIAAQMGAHILRVHDVQETSDAVKIVNMLNQI